MTLYIEPASDFSSAWLATLAAVDAQGGTATHVITTVTDPGEENAGIRSSLDALLYARYLGGRRIQRIDTVAGTIFPSALYRDQGFAWDPDLAAPAATALDEAAADLYRDYADMLPILETDSSNKLGLYFARMIHWPKGQGQGENQLAGRIRYLRGERRQGHGRANAADIAVAGDGVYAPSPAAGVQLYAADDRRTQGFPCLVHIDLSVHGGRLHLLAVYRHWHLITKGYGNLLGLSHLQSFLSQQSGYPVGELVVVAGTANSERPAWRGKRGVDAIIAEASAAASGPK
jgi:hypothetical protein